MVTDKAAKIPHDAFLFPDSKKPLASTNGYVTLCSPERAQCRQFKPQNRGFRYKSSSTLDSALLRPYFMRVSGLLNVHMCCPLFSFCLIIRRNQSSITRFYRIANYSLPNEENLQICKFLQKVSLRFLPRSDCAYPFLSVPNYCSNLFGIICFMPWDFADVR